MKRIKTIFLKCFMKKSTLLITILKFIFIIQIIECMDSNNDNDTAFNKDANFNENTKKIKKRRANKKNIPIGHNARKIITEWLKKGLTPTNAFNNAKKMGIINNQGLIIKSNDNNPQKVNINMIAKWKNKLATQASLTDAKKKNILDIWTKK